VTIHEHREANRIVNNRYTDAIVVNLFTYTEDNKKSYSSIYMRSFQDIDEKNFNCSSEFNKGDFMVSQDFVPISVIKTVLRELKEYYFEDRSSIEALRESYAQPNDEEFRDLLGLTQDYNRLLEVIIPCMECKKMKAFIKLPCECTICKQCLKLSVNLRKCVRCGKGLN